MYLWFALCKPISKKKISDVDEYFTSAFAEFEKLNPLHYVPVLVDGNVVVSDSYAILLVGICCS